MDLIVVDPEGAVGTALSNSLPGVNVFSVVDANALRAQTQCSEDDLPCVICLTEQDLLACAQWRPQLSLIYLAQHTVTAEQTISIMRAGARDIWLPTDNSEIRRASLHRVHGAAAESRVTLAETARDRETARKIQQGMWPADASELANYRFSRRLLPAATLTGDLVDYFRVGERYLTFFVADVAGHGTSSALLTVVLKNISWRLQQRYGRPRFRAPADVLGWINDRLIEQSAGIHVAMFLGVIDLQTQTLHYSSAAHFPPSLMVSADAQVTSLEQRGKPLGLFADAKYESAAIDIAAGDRLVVFSDGVLELLQHAELAVKEQALQQQAAATQSVDALWSNITDKVSGEDDVSLLVVERIG